MRRLLWKAEVTKLQIHTESLSPQRQKSPGMKQRPNCSSVAVLFKMSELPAESAAVFPMIPEGDPAKYYNSL